MEHIADEILPPIKLLAKIIIRRKKRRRRNSTESFMRPNRRLWGEGLHWGVGVYISNEDRNETGASLLSAEHHHHPHTREKYFFPRLSMRRETSENLSRIEIR